MQRREGQTPDDAEPKSVLGVWVEDLLGSLKELDPPEIASPPRWRQGLCLWGWFFYLAGTGFFFAGVISFLTVMLIHGIAWFNTVCKGWFFP